jgi:enoyl-CoA hydratase
MSVQVITQNHTAVIGLDRPPVNALTVEFANEIADAVEAAAGDMAIRSAVLHGESGKFCAGFDIKYLQHNTPDQAVARNKLLLAAFRRIQDCRLPVIAAIESYALGGGCELALVCDFRLADSSAVLGLPEINLGGVPGIGGMKRLSRVVGVSGAKRMVMTGERFPAVKAFEMGLVDELSDGDVLGAALALAELIGQRPPLAVAEAKRAINDGFDVSLDEGLQADLRAVYNVAGTNDRAECVAAFLDKRRAVITGT